MCYRWQNAGDCENATTRSGIGMLFVFAERAIPCYAQGAIRIALYELA